MRFRIAELSNACWQEDPRILLIKAYFRVVGYENV